MKKLLFLCLVACCLFTACITSRNKSEHPVQKATGIQIPDTMKTSPLFKLFCRELSEDMQKKTGAEKYIPSEKLQKKYALYQAGDQFRVRGYIYFNQLFDRKSLEELGGSGTVYTNEIQSFSIPVERLQQLVLLPGITYIEISQKVKLIK